MELLHLPSQPMLLSTGVSQLNFEGNSNKEILFSGSIAPHLTMEVVGVGTEKTPPLLSQFILYRCGRLITPNRKGTLEKGRY